MSSTNINVVFHYPTLGHLETEFPAGTCAGEIITSLRSHPELSVAATELLEIQEDRLCQGFLIHIDAERAWCDIAKITPQNNMLIIASNKTNFRMGERLRTFQGGPAESCVLCNSAFAITGKGERPMCGSCFVKWTEAIAAKNLVESGLSDDDLVVIALSGERDSTVASSLLVSYTKLAELSLRIRPYFMNNGNEGEHLYRTKCAQAAQAFCDANNLKLVKTSLPEGSVCHLDRMMQSPCHEDACIPCHLGYTVSCAHNQKDEINEPYFLLAGTTLTDLMFSELAGGSPTEPLDNYPKVLEPLYALEDREVSIYAALKQIDYHVGDCPHSDSAHRYESNHEVELVRQVAGPLVKNLSLKGRREREGFIDTRQRIFNPIYGLFDPSLQVHSIGYQDGLEGPFAVKGLKAKDTSICPNCSGLIMYDSLGKLLSEAHACPPNRTQENVGVERAVVEEFVAVTNKPFDPAHKPILFSHRFRLKSELAVKFGPKHILFFHQAKNQVFSIEGKHDWQRQLVQTWHGVWQEKDSLSNILKTNSEIQEAHLAHWISRLQETGLIELEKEEISNTDLFLVDDLGIFDETEFSDSDGKHWQVVRRESAKRMFSKEVQASATTVLLCSNDLSEHLKAAEWAMEKEKMVLHASLAGNLFYLGPISSPSKRSCFNCLHLHLSQQGVEAFSYDLKGSSEFDADSATIMCSLLRKWTSWHKNSPHDNWVRCYDLYDCISQRLNLFPHQKCTVCS